MDYTPILSGEEKKWLKEHGAIRIGFLKDDTGISTIEMPDGRFSGASRGASIGHVCPEAAAGGNIGLLQEGDIIEIDIPNSKINAQVSDEEFDARRKDHVAPPSKATSGWLARYQRNVSASCKGAVME